MEHGIDNNYRANQMGSRVMAAGFLAAIRDMLPNALIVNRSYMGGFSPSTAVSEGKAAKAALDKIEAVHESMSRWRIEAAPEAEAACLAYHQLRAQAQADYKVVRERAVRTLAAQEGL